MGKTRERLLKTAEKINEGLSEALQLLPCPPCGAGEHFFCLGPDSVNSFCCCASRRATEITNSSPGNATKTPDEITDVQSTGRKRAAAMYPITEGMICEWSKLAKAGGGVVPIVGCLGNLAVNIHHGPDKNTLNNNPENIHRICSPCHNYWHAKNDEYYGERPPGTEPFIPLDGNEWFAHDSETQAELEQIITAQLGRKQPKKK